MTKELTFEEKIKQLFKDGGVFRVRFPTLDSLEKMILNLYGEDQKEKDEKFQERLEQTRELYKKAFREESLRMQRRESERKQELLDLYDDFLNVEHFRVSKEWKERMKKKFEELLGSKEEEEKTK